MPPHTRLPSSFQLRPPRLHREAICSSVLSIESVISATALPLHFGRFGIRGHGRTLPSPIVRKHGTQEDSGLQNCEEVGRRSDTHPPHHRSFGIKYLAGKRSQNLHDKGLTRKIFITDELRRWSVQPHRYLRS